MFRFYLLRTCCPKTGIFRVFFHLYIYIYIYNLRKSRSFILSIFCVPKIMFGSITLIKGPKFCGKTTRLFELADIDMEKGHRIVFIKYFGDNPYAKSTPEIVSHEFESKPTIVVKDLCELYDLLKRASIDSVFIDNGHLFNDNIDSVVGSLSTRGYHVYVTSLNCDLHLKVCF